MHKPSKSIRGSNASRVRALLKQRPKPKFHFGELVVDPNEPADVGAIDAIYADLDAAIDAGVVDDDWYGELDVRPKTPKSGIWYSIVLGHGAILAGEKDLRRGA